MNRSKYNTYDERTELTRTQFLELFSERERDFSYCFIPDVGIVTLENVLLRKPIGEKDILFNQNLMIYLFQRFNLMEPGLINAVEQLLEFRNIPWAGLLKRKFYLQSKGSLKDLEYRTYFFKVERMRITKYRTRKNEEGLAYLIKEKAVNYNGEGKLNRPDEIVKMLNEVFDMKNETEEYLYLLCFNTSFKLLGIMEISHGTVNSSVVTPREVMQKALLCNASRFIIAHNHPGESVCPSESDTMVFRTLVDAGKLMNVPLIDSIIIGGDDYFSYADAGYLKG